MNTAVITAKRICMMYCRNAVRLPIGMSPRSTSPAPNHRIATVDRFMIPRRAGNARAKIRFTRSDVAVRSAFTTSKRARSDRTRMNARTTRTPVICSRSTCVIRSIFTWTWRKSGTAFQSNTPITAPMSGTITTMSQDSVASSRRAMMIPPIARIGALTRMVSAICRKSCTCWTSFVLRVMSDAVPKRFISRAEKLCTRSKTAPRTSRPTPIDVCEAKYTATTAKRPSSSVIPSMTAPVRQM